MPNLQNEGAYCCCSTCVILILCMIVFSSALLGFGVACCCVVRYCCFAIVCTAVASSSLSCCAGILVNTYRYICGAILLLAICVYCAPTVALPRPLYVPIFLEPYDIGAEAANRRAAFVYSKSGTIPRFQSARSKSCPTLHNRCDVQQILLCD